MIFAIIYFGVALIIFLFLFFEMRKDYKTKGVLPDLDMLVLFPIMWPIMLPVLMGILFIQVIENFVEWLLKR